jgi:hypothetical protein
MKVTQTIAAGSTDGLRRIREASQAGLTLCFPAIPDHASLRIGTMREIMKDVAAHHSLTVPELLAKLEL